MKLISKIALAASVTVASLCANDVIATVNGKAIDTEYVNKILKGQNYDKLPDAKKRDIVNRLVERELLAENAKKAGIEKDKTYLSNLENVKKDILIKTWIDKVYNKTLISDSEANNYYQKNKKVYTIPEKVHARHILLKTEGEAKEIIGELKKLKGEDLKKKFIELAKSKSTGPSGRKGGDLNYFAKAVMVKPFADAAFSLKKGELSLDPVKTKFGYHVIYVEDKKPESVKPFKDVKNSIIKKLREEEFNKKIKETIENSKKNAKIESKILNSKKDNK